MSDDLIPRMLPPYRLSSGWTVLPAWLPLPGMGGLPVNSFVLDGQEPVLVDTGLSSLGPDFVKSLASVIDPAGLRWIWISHMDADHVGNLQAVLDLAPEARVVTNFLGMGKMQLAGMPCDRVHLLAPGDRLSVAGGDLVPLRPPYYDAPETMGFHSTADGTVFLGDCFGALLPQPAEDLAEVPETQLTEGLAIWSAVDAPWLALCGPERLDGSFAGLASLQTSQLLTSHLPPSRKEAAGVIAQLCRDARSAAGIAVDPLALTNLGVGRTGTLSQVA